LNSTQSDWVTIAVLGRARGIHGEVTAHSYSSKPERFRRLKSVRVVCEGATAPAMHEVEQVWEHGEVLVFKFAGVNSMTDAEKLRGAEVQVPVAERVELEADEYFHSDLIGCEVRERASGRVVGRVTDFQEYGGPPLLDVDNGRVLIPFVKAICVDIRPAEKLILADLPEGLENLSQ
jgi:16S rRNA processing protein RimM